MVLNIIFIYSVLVEMDQKFCQPHICFKYPVTGMIQEYNCYFRHECELADSDDDRQNKIKKQKRPWLKKILRTMVYETSMKMVVCCCVRMNANIKSTMKFEVESIVEKFCSSIQNGEGNFIQKNQTFFLKLCLNLLINL